MYGDNRGGKRRAVLCVFSSIELDRGFLASVSFLRICNMNDLTYLECKFTCYYFKLNEIGSLSVVDFKLFKSRYIIGWIRSNSNELVIGDFSNEYFFSRTLTFYPRMYLRKFVLLLLCFISYFNLNEIGNGIDFKLFKSRYNQLNSIELDRTWSGISDFSNEYFFSSNLKYEFYPRIYLRRFTCCYFNLNEIGNLNVVDFKLFGIKVLQNLYAVSFLRIFNMNFILECI